MTERKKKCAVAGILLALFLMGGFFVREAGVCFDEALEQKILYMNVLQYGDTLHISKLSNWFQWKEDIIPICQSEERDHGISPYYLCALFLMKLDTHPEAAQLQSLVWHIYTYLLFFLGVIYLYRLLKELFKSRKTALIGAGMLFLTPRIFADGLYNNKDTVLLSLVIVMLFYGVRFLRRRDFPSAVLLGISAGFACNMKISGIYVFALIGAWYLLMLTWEKKWSLRTFFVGLTAAGMGFASYLLLTPAIWGEGFHLWKFLQWNLSNTTQFTRLDGEVLFEGTMYRHSTNPLPWYYLPKLIALTIPVYISVLLWSSVGIWIYKGIKRQWKDTDSLYPLFALIPAIPVLVAMLSHPNLYNGWRHMYFIYGAMVVMATYTVQFLLRERQGRTGKTATGVLIVFLAVNGAGIICTGEGSVGYTNILTGGDAAGRYELDYYGVTAKKILMSLVDRYGEIYIKADGAGAIFINANVLPESYREQIHFLYTDEEGRQLAEEGKLALACVNPSYDSIPQGDDVNWLEDWTAWGNTYMKIRQY